MSIRPMIAALPAKPVPIADALTTPYWEAANEHRLEIQRCQQCLAYHHPPVAMCTRCQAEDLRFEPVRGTGTIYTYTITHDARTPAFAARQPFAIVWVDLDEQPGVRIVANMPDVPLADVQIGARVSVTFEQIAPDVTLPQFTLMPWPAEQACAATEAPAQ